MEIVNFSDNYLAQVADLYDRVFTGPPWFDPPLGQEEAVRYIQGELTKPFSRALLAISRQTPIGFAWGYQSTNLKFARSKYELPTSQDEIFQIVSDYSYFYISEVGVDPSLQGQGVGTLLAENLVTNQLPLLMRTLNTSPMLAIATNKLSMVPIIAPWLDKKDPENSNRVILVKI